MSEQELRWFDNVKKAFYESDRAYTEGRAHDHCFLLDWSQPRSRSFGSIADGRLTCNGHMIWERLRRILAKFITGIDAMIAYPRIVAGEQEGSLSITIAPPLGSVRPGRTGQV